MTKMRKALVIVKQPCSEFYKDEGGKSNFIQTTVKLQYQSTGKLQRGKAKKIQLREPLPLRVVLHYESEIAVEKRDQGILTVKQSEIAPLCIEPETLTGSVHFRIEKVSRRKDGQRFKLFIEPDPTAGGDSSIPGVFTSPICVLSKRKAPADSSRDAAKRRKVSVSDLSAVEVRMRRRLDSLQRTIEQLLGLIQSQASRLVTLERVVRANTRLRADLERARNEERALGRGGSNGHSPPSLDCSDPTMYKAQCMSDNLGVDLVMPHYALSNSRNDAGGGIPVCFGLFDEKPDGLEHSSARLSPVATTQQVAHLSDSDASPLLLPAADADLPAVDTGLLPLSALSSLPSGGGDTAAGASTEEQRQQIQFNFGKPSTPLPSIVLGRTDSR